MNPNGQRTNLVTTFHCTDCGGLLRLSYPLTGVKAEYDSAGITGALKVENKIHLEPCRKCVGEARKPMELLREILKAANHTQGEG